jgi:excisionase family DNA binding protein
MSSIKENQSSFTHPISGIDFKFFYVSEVAAMLRVGVPIIYTLIHERKLDAIKIGRAWKIPETAITAYIESVSHR